MAVWQKLIDAQIEEKVKQSKATRERQRKSKESKKTPQKSRLGGLFSKMKSAVATGVSKIWTTAVKSSKSKTKWTRMAAY